jgi:hypothetical protein
MGQPTSLIPAITLHLCNKQSFIQLCYFLCWNATYETQNGIMAVVFNTPLWEKQFCKKKTSILPKDDVIVPHTEHICRIANKTQEFLLGIKLHWNVVQGQWRETGWNQYYTQTYFSEIPQMLCTGGMGFQNCQHKLPQISQNWNNLMQQQCKNANWSGSG